MGRRFQVTFWTHSLPRAGQLLAYGLKSRIIFTTAPTRDSADVQPTGDLSVSLLPAQVQMKHLAAGKRYRLEQLAGQPITVHNTSNHPVRVELHMLSAAASGTPLNADDAELLDVAKVHLEPASIMLAPGESRAVTGEVVMNGGRAGKGKNLVCVVAASVADELVRTQIYSRLRTDSR